MVDILVEGLKVTVFGMVITFSGLWLLWLSVRIMGFFFDTGAENA